MIKRIILFLVLNFLGLYLGAQFTSSGVSSDWYENLNKAPWTPPGWVFGAAWTFIMICFSFYLAFLWEKIEKNEFIPLYAIAWLLNVAWNPIFFKMHQMEVGLVVIISLLVIVGIYLFRYWNKLKMKSILILPYFIWMLIATSLNAYASLMN